MQPPSALSGQGPFAEEEQTELVFVWSAVFVGVVLRLWQYLLNRSLWLDEALLVSNIIHRTYAGLLKPLDFGQGAPLGFLFLERLLIQHWGSGEHVLRLVPLIAGVFSLSLFYAVAKRAVSAAAVPIALVLFAISPPLIYYSSEVKQYSSDVSIALLLYFIALSASLATWDNVRIAVLALIGALAVWFSHSAVFVLAGIGTVFAVNLIIAGNWKLLGRFTIAYSLIIGSLTILYVVSLRNLVHDDYLLGYWAKDFMPLPPKSASDFRWFYGKFFEFLHNPVGLSFSGLAAFALIAGGFHLYGRDRVRFWLLLSPSIFTLLASGLHKYPFGGRLTLFLVPSAILLIAEGAAAVRMITRLSAPMVGYVLVVLLFVDPAPYLCRHFARPDVLVTAPGIPLPEEIQPVLTYVRSHQGPMDAIYIFGDSRAAYEYYRDRDHLDDRNVLFSTVAGHNPRDYVADIDRLRGRRVWVIFSHVNTVDTYALNYLHFYLDTIGQEFDTFSSAGAGVYLYELTRK